ncbi:MAG: hypothetical protein PHX80_04410 [Candidatus Nanoarchaeia archaeon]|nr:hypothetical protein [Candidatus Nanoarchaeia archaeon]MDD5551258.1 hypothetical protein [Candidatus Omnitrophota bacterium]
MVKKKTAKPISKKKGNQKKLKKTSPVSSKKAKKVQFNRGYNEFLSEYSKWKKETGIKSKGRGGHFHDAGRIWKDVKGKPKVIENLDVILPQYFYKEQDRRQLLIDYFSMQEFHNWDEKSLHFSFKESPYYKEGDKLTLVDTDGFQIDMTQEIDAAQIYRQFQNEVDAEARNKYDLFVLDDVIDVEGLKGNLEVRYKVVDNIYYKPTAHEGVKSDWDIKTRKAVGLKEPSVREKVKKIMPHKLTAFDKSYKKKYGEYPPGSELEEEKPAVTTVTTESELDRLIKKKQSLMEDIRFAKEMGMDYSQDLEKLKELKSKIDNY